MVTTMGFNVRTAAHLTGLTEERIRYWARTDVQEPSLVYDKEAHQYGYLYSFQDLVSLRTLRNLRDEHDFPLQSLRRIGEWLRDHYNQPWATLRFYAAGDQLAFTDEDRQLISATQRGQAMFEEITVDLEQVSSEIERQARRLRERDPDDYGKIEQQRLVFQHRPVIAGTRIPVDTIQNYIEDGYSAKDIILLYPFLDEADIRAVSEYVLRDEQDRPAIG